MNSCGTARSNLADQQTQVGMAELYTAKTVRRYGEASPRVELP